MPIQITGLSGFDSSSVITQLVALAQEPVTALDTKKGQVDSASTTINNYSTKLATLKTASTALSTTSGFSSMTATSSDTGIVATTNGSATASSFSIEVTQLARAQKTRSDPQTSATTALGQAGDLTIQVGANTAITINVLATDTLANIATKISQSGGRVSAGIINAGGSYRLSIQGLDSGAANAVTFGQTGTVALGLGTPASTIETAQDAKLTIDGLAVTRPTNSIADAISGVTMALTKTTPVGTPATLKVSTDSTSLKTKISAFVTAYNDIVNTTHQVTGYGTSKASNSVLAADATLRRALDTIARTTTGAVPGGTGNYKSMATVGLTTSRDGTLTFDGTKLDAALEKDSDAVRRLFVADTSIGATGIMKTLADAINLMITDKGGIKTRVEALSAQSKRLAESREVKAKRVDVYEQQLRKQFAELDQAMSKYSSMGSALSSLSTTY
jgi:flagellar hook-associated protein 2